MSIESLTAASAQEDADPHQSLSRTEALMGGRGTITVVGGSALLLDAAFELARRCESLWSRFIHSSDIMRLNRAEGRVVRVDGLTAALVEAMVEGHRLTAGAFDPTVLPDVLRAGYDRSALDASRQTVLPASAVASGQMKDVRVDGCEVQLPFGTTLDAGGIGKGAAADAASHLVMSAGARGVLVEIGGDIVIGGASPDGGSWRLGIEDPLAGPDRGPDDLHVDVVQISHGALVTSSIRKRVFEVGGRQMHHLIDPATHRSAITDVQTISVIADTGTRAEVLTKVGFFAEPTEYLTWLTTVGAAGVVILADGTRRESENWGEHR